MKYSSIKAIFGSLISFAIVGCINASCTYDISGDTWCRHTSTTPTSRFTNFYEVGEVWNDGPCVECRCHPVTYRTHLNCSLLVEDGKTGPDEVETYFINLGNVYPTSCPFAFTQVTDSNKHLASQLFVVYRFVDTVATSCCDRMQLAVLPDDCEAIPDDSDQCIFKFVLKSNNNIECSGNMAMSG
ncbi:uncharacterized protein LOC144427186 [Styela clava]